MTDHYLAELLAYDPGAGLDPIVDWATVGDTPAWTLVGTPTRSAAAATIYGTPLDLLGDDDAGAAEYAYRTIAFTGNGSKVVSFLVKKSSSYNGHFVQLYDATAPATRLLVSIDFTAAWPVVTASTGSILAVVPYGAGFWILALATGVVAANTNRLYVSPTDGTVGHMAALYIGCVRAWNSATYVGPRMLRYSTHGFTTGPAESPANTYYDYRLRQPVDVARDCWASGTTSGQSRIGFGDLVLGNEDGELDALLGYGFDGRAVTIRRTAEPFPAYPADFDTVFVGTMEQPVCGLDEVRLRIRDRQYETQVPLQATKYAGDNALPDGLEGVADDLKGKPKPVCLGSVSNVPAVLVNSSKLIYQVHDGAIADVSEVYDSGIPLFSDVWDLPTSNNTALYAVASDGAGTLVTVGTYPATSTDAGATWTQRAFNAMGAARCVAFGAGLFVAGGSAADLGEIETSPTGVTWTPRVSPFAGTAPVDGICWDGTQFIAVSGNEIATSTNGITWTLQTWSGTVTVWLGVAAGGVSGHARLVAVGTGGTMASSDDGGVTWVERTSGFGATNVADVAYGRGLWVAVGYSGKVSTSVDGTTWTVRDAGLGTVTIYAVAYGAGRFVVAGAGNIAATSFDGIQWQQRTCGWGGLAIGMLHTGSTFIAVGGTMVALNQPRRADYANAADLEDDTLAPVPGQIGIYPAGGYFRLGAPPAGLVTADVTQGAAAANRTAAQLANLVLARAITSETFVAADVTALDAAAAYVLGHWQGTEETTCAAVLDALLGSVGAWWSCDQLGQFRMRQLIAPAGAPAATFVPSDVVAGSLRRLATLDEGHGLPIYRQTVRWGKNYAVQETDLAAGVSDARRGVVSKEWREATYSDADVQRQYLLAPALVDDSLLTTAADALTEATRRQVLRGLRRDRYELVVDLHADVDALDLGSVVSLVYPRYDLTTGKLFVVTGLARESQTRRLRLSLWG